MQNKEQPAEPVAWAQLGTLNGKSYLRMAYDRVPYPPPPDVVRNLNLKPLFEHPDPRVSMLEGLNRQLVDKANRLVVQSARDAERLAELEGLLREAQGTLQKIKLRIHFIGWPAEPKREDGCVDWREEIRALEDSLKRIEAALGEG